MNKPNGQTYLNPNYDEVIKFAKDLSVRKIPGIGRMTELVLASLDIYKCQDILDKSTEILISFSERQSYFLFRAAVGIARNYHEEEDEDGCQKSISCRETSKPLSTLEQF